MNKKSKAENMKTIKETIAKINKEIKAENKKIKAEIEKIIANGYAETHIGYHPDYRFRDGFWQRGCYAHVAGQRIGESYYIYASSWGKLLEAVKMANEW